MAEQQATSEQSHWCLDSFHCPRCIERAERRHALTTAVDCPGHAQTPACWCGNPDDRERVHRAQACEPWQTPASSAVPAPDRKGSSRAVDGGDVL